MKTHPQVLSDYVIYSKYKLCLKYLSGINFIKLSVVYSSNTDYNRCCRPMPGQTFKQISAFKILINIAGGFGSPAVFGSPPSFGSKPVFGATPQFGSGSFGAQSSGFGSPAAFGAQAVSPSSGFGGSSSGFGA